MKRGPKPRKINQDLLEQIEHHATVFQSGLQKRGLSNAGIRKHQTQLQIFLNWAYSEDHLEKPQKLNKIKVFHNGPVIFSLSEVEKIQKCIEKSLLVASSHYQERCIKIISGHF